MAVEIVTKDDLQLFRVQLMNEFKEMLGEKLQPHAEYMHGYKSSDVREILACSVNKLVSLRVSRNLRKKKWEGRYIDKKDIRKLVKKGLIIVDIDNFI